MERTYAEYAARQAMELLAIDSPTGFTARAADWVQRAFEELGYTAPVSYTHLTLPTIA